MKKLVLTIAIVLGMGIAATAQGGGLFKYGEAADQNRGGGLMKGDGVDMNFPLHGGTGDADAPLTGGALLLIGFGAAYALKKRNEK